MRGRMIGVCALLSASAAQAERVSEPYAKVGYWEITTENHSVCVMKSGYPGKVADGDQALMVAYNAQQKTAVLSWTPRKPELPALTDSLDLELSFLKGRSLNESWGSQPFQVAKLADTYSFIHVFKGSTASDRFLRDLASHDALALFFGPGMLTSLPLKASDAVTKLRECSSKIVERDGSDRLQK
jgi:hypothetical protein